MSPGGSQVNPSPPLLSEVLCTMWTHSVTGDREAAPLTPRTPPPHLLSAGVLASGTWELGLTVVGGGLGG